MRERWRFSEVSSRGPQPSRQAEWLVFVAPVVFFLLQCLRYLRLRKLAETDLVQYVPDDAFYYLILGRNFSTLHRWTFDGTAPATGFHLLWGYSIALLYWLFPSISLRQIFALLFFGGTLLMTAGLALVCLTVRRTMGRFALLGPVSLFFSYWAVNQANLLMESSLVVLFVALAFYLVVGRDAAGTSVTLCLSFLVGMLGMLSRSDFGLVPFVLLAAFVPVVFRRGRVVSMIAGAVIGLVLIVGHTRVASGHFVQSSARAKRHWSQVMGDKIQRPFFFAITPLRPDTTTKKNQPGTTAIQALEILSLFPLAMAVALRDKTGELLQVAGVAVAIIFGYIFLYRYDSAALQPWYYANFLVPYSLLTAIVLRPLRQLWRVAGTAIVLCNVAASAQTWLHRPWPEQAGFYAAGTALRAHPEWKPAGAWNAGIESYYADGGVIDLDGLVNDDVLSYILQDRLADYLAQRKIAHLVDDREMLYDAQAQDRGGYPAETLTACVRSETSLWRMAEYHRAGDWVVLSKLDPACVRQRPGVRAAHGR